MMEAKLNKKSKKKTIEKLRNKKDNPTKSKMELEISSEYLFILFRYCPNIIFKILNILIIQYN